LKCSHCSRENPVNAQVCVNCGQVLVVNMQPTAASIPRFLPKETPQQPDTYYLCLRCGNPVPEGFFTCSHCRWDLRKPFKASSGFGCGSCLGLLLMRLLGFAVASGVSFGVGFVSASLGLGVTAASLITGLISTLLSLVPSVVSWLFGSLRRVMTMTLLFIVFSFAILGYWTPARAQTDIPKQALNRLMYAYGMEAINWRVDETHPGYWVDMKARQSNYSYTNTAGVLDVSARYGKNGGEIWVQESMKQWLNCGPTEENFHGLAAYSFLCRDGDYIEGFVWGMDNWALVTINRLELPEVPAANLAEDLYYIMLELAKSPAKPPTITPTATKPTALPGLPANPQPQGGKWTQKDVTRMAVTVMEKYAQEKGWEKRVVCSSIPCLANGKYVSNPQYVFEANNGEITDAGPIKTVGGDLLVNAVSSGKGSYYFVAGAVEYDDQQVNNGLGQVSYRIDIIYLPERNKLSTIFDVISNQIIFNPAYNNASTDALDHQAISFHGENAVYVRQTIHVQSAGMSEAWPQRDEWFLWIQYPWIFQVWANQSQNISGVHTLHIPLFDSQTEPEILYLLAAQAGMFNPPSAQPAPARPAPEQPYVEPAAPPENIPPSISEDDLPDFSEEELLGLLALLSPAALLPALGVAGISTLLDLLRLRSQIPAGMVKSPIFGYGPVSPEAAAYQRKLLEQGYEYNPQTRRMTVPKVPSPVDGTMVSKSQAAREREFLSKGFKWSDTYGWKTRDELAHLQTNLDQQRNYVQSGQAHRDMQKAARDELHQSEEYNALQEQIRQGKSRRAEQIRAAIEELNALQERHSADHQANIDYFNTLSAGATWTGIAAGAIVAGLGTAIVGLGAVAGSVTPTAIQIAGYTLHAKTIATAFPFVTAIASGASEGYFNDLGLRGTLDKIRAKTAKALLDKLVGDKLLNPLNKYLTRGFSGPFRDFFGHGTPNAVIQPLADGAAEEVKDLLYNGVQQISGAGDYIENGLEKKVIKPVFDNPLSLLLGWNPGTIPNTLFPQ